MLQHQRMAQMAQAQGGDPQRSGTPIVRNGKIVGYAVQVDPKAKQLPTTMIGSLPAADNNFPELEDYSILEPEIILKGGDAPLRLIEKPGAPNQPGARQVVVNGKLLTLVPFQGTPGSQPRPGMTTLQHRPIHPGRMPLPPGKLPLPRGILPNPSYRKAGSPIIVHPSQGVRNPSQMRSILRTQIHAPLRMPPMGPGGRLPLPPNLEDVQCDFCSVKLPRSILHMHMKMRHSELMQDKFPNSSPKPKDVSSNPAESGNDSEQIQCTPEIVFDNDDNDNTTEKNEGDKNNSSEVLEMNPSNKSVDQEPGRGPLADPLAI
jgi:hypothetical protein